MVQGVWSEDPQAQLEATTQFRKLLSIGRYRPQLLAALRLLQLLCPRQQRAATCVVSQGALLHAKRSPCAAPLRKPRLPFSLARPAAERNPPIEEVIAQNVIPRFVQFLQRADVPQLQFEASPAAAAVSRVFPLLGCSSGLSGCHGRPACAHAPPAQPPGPAHPCRRRGR